MPPVSDPDVASAWTEEMLNPAVVFADGEWEAWKLDSSLPGAARYRSFYELAEAEARDVMAR